MPKQKALQWTKSKGPKVRSSTHIYTSNPLYEPPSHPHTHIHLNKHTHAQPIPYFETSAKDATRVEAAFLEAAQLALQQTSQEKDE